MKKTVSNKDYDNRWFRDQIGASRVKQAIWYCINVIFLINPFNPSSSLKRFFLRMFGARIGVGVVLKPAINVKYPWKLSIGDYSWIGEQVWIDNLARVDIGSNVCLSQGAMILTGNHDYSKTGFDLMVSPIILGDGVWIGARAIICPGVQCSTHAVLTAGSIATQALEAYKIYQGNPAVAVKERMIE